MVFLLGTAGGSFLERSPLRVLQFRRKGPPFRWNVSVGGVVEVATST